MNVLEAVVLGIVEALTEYVPVSSTGHLILTSHLFGIEDDAFTKAFEIVIQGGSILAVILFYWKLLWKHLKNLMSFEAQAVQFYLKLFVAFFPAAFVGLLFYKKIKHYLFGPLPVVVALVVGGIAMVLIERRFKTSPENDEDKEITMKGAFVVGLCQILSLWPGTSRAMTTLIGGRLVGLSAYKSAEFSFLLATPIILAATAYDLLKIGPDLFQDIEKIKLLLIGTTVSFVVSLFVIKAFLGFLKSHSLEVFGWYRIALGILFYYFFL